MGLVMVTRGYTYIAILILALWMAMKSRLNPSPIIALNIERILAIALGFGLFIVGMAAFADLFPPILGTGGGYVGL